MDPGRQAALIDAIREESRIFPVAIVFVIDAAVRTVDFAVPSFWLRVSNDPLVRITAMAMVTDSVAVGIAARGFGAANRFRNHPLEVRTFTSEEAAVAWAKQVPRPAAPLHA
jgi:hypothetical protein